MPVEQVVAQGVGAGVAVIGVPGQQTIEVASDGQLQFTGVSVPLEGDDEIERALTLGHRAIAAQPGLRGFVGVDATATTVVPEGWRCDRLADGTLRMEVA